MDSDINKVFSFFGTTNGKILIFIVIVGLAIYFGSKFIREKAEKEKYNGNTKKDIIIAIKADFADWYIYTKMQNELESAGRKFTEGMVNYYDENFKVQLTGDSLRDSLRGLNVPADTWADFGFLIGQKIMLTPYWRGDSTTGEGGQDGLVINNQFR